MAARPRGWLRRERDAMQERYGIDVLDLPKPALRMLRQDRLDALELVYIAEEIAKLRRQKP